MKSNTPLTFQTFTICCPLGENLLRDNLALGFKGCAIGDCGISWSPLGRYLAMISGRWMVYHFSTSRFLGTNILSKKKRRFMDHLKSVRFFYPASTQLPAPNPFRKTSNTDVGKVWYMDLLSLCSTSLHIAL